jgi:hypothetical protein
MTKLTMTIEEAMLLISPLGRNPSHDGRAGYQPLTPGQYKKRQDVVSRFGFDNVFIDTILKKTLKDYQRWTVI